MWKSDRTESTGIQYNNGGSQLSRNAMTDPRQRQTLLGTGPL